MYLRGPVLIIFSVCCIGVAAMAHHVQYRQNMSKSLDQVAAVYDCAKDGFNTSAGRITCVTPVSFDFMKGLLDNGPFR